MALIKWSRLLLELLFLENSLTNSHVINRLMVEKKEKREDKFIVGVIDGTKWACELGCILLLRPSITHFVSWSCLAVVPCLSLLFGTPEA